MRNRSIHIEGCLVYIDDHTENSHIHTAVLKWLGDVKADYVKIRTTANDIIIEMPNETQAQKLKIILNRANDIFN